MNSYRSDVTVEQRYSDPRASYYQRQDAYGYHKSEDNRPQEMMRPDPGGRSEYDQRGPRYSDHTDYHSSQQQFHQSNEYSNHIQQHRYPDTFQNVDRPRQDRNSWGQYRQEQNVPTQSRRNEPQGGGHGEGPQTYNDQYQQQQRSPTNNLNYNEFRQPSQGDGRDKNFYRREDQAREIQSYEDKSRNDPRQQPHHLSDERGYAGPPSRRDDQNWNHDQMQRHDDTRNSLRYQQYDDQPQSGADYAPRQDYRTYPNQGERGRQQYNTDAPVRNQYSDQRQPSYQQQQNRDFRSEGTRESIPLEPPVAPPQIVAETRGSAAVFGIVAKVEPPSRPPAVTLPTQQYGPPYTQYRDREPPDEKARQRLSQSNFQQKTSHALTPILEQPSPPLSPRQTVNQSQGPDARWQDQRSNTHIHRQFESGPENHANRLENNRPYRNEQYGLGTKQPLYISGPSYKAPSSNGQGYRDRPPSQGNEDPASNRFREEYQESSGYGSESTYLTDRSQRDANIRAYDDRPSPNRNNPYYDSRGSQNWNRGPEEPRKMETLRSPPQRVRFQDAYQDSHKNPSSSTRDMPNQRQGDEYDNQGRQAPFREDRQAPENGYRDYQHETHDRGMYNQNHHGGMQTVVSNQPQYMPRDYNSHQDMNAPRGLNGPPGHNNRNPESGVEVTHTKGVRAVKNLFEQKSDQRRPPPAPKPMISPKPNFGSNVNARPVPPRPRDLSDSGYRDNRDRDNQGHFNFPQNPPALKSPSYDNRAVQYDGHQQSLHSKSMENLDDRSRFNPSSHQQAHPASYDDNRDQRGYRNSYSGEKDTRPMIIGVKYNQDNVPDDYRSNQPPQGMQNWKRSSWDTQNESRAQYNGPQRNRTVMSPTRMSHDASPSVENSGVRWKSEPNIKQMPNNDRYDSRPNEQSYSHSSQPRNSNNEGNFIPDIVARSYQALNNDPSLPAEQSRQQHDRYDSGFPPPVQSDLPPPPPQKWENDSGNRNSMERWPTPPPLVQQPAAPISDSGPKTYGQHRVDPGPTGYTDDWRRPAPAQHIHHSRSDQNNQMQPRPPATRYPPQTQKPIIHIPPPPRQPYQDSDDDSSEGIDVDAPTPPPSKINKPFRAPPFLHENRSDSPYERNKPVPVASRNADPRSYGPAHTYQQQELRDEPVSRQAGYGRQGAERPYQTSQQQKISIQSAPQPYKKTKPLSPTIKSPSPTKPQRNSIQLNSPQAETANAGEFDFGVGHTQVLNHASSRDKQRLSKSGALANRKPPSRQGSTSNLVEVGIDDFQIEVTDNDLTHHPTPIEVHREESMRVIREKKLAATSQMRKTSSSSDVASQLERNSQTGAVAKGENSSAQVPKADTKLLFKVPSTDVSKLETAHPIPTITEPASNAKRRPPTYLGFGNTPETNPKHKSKSDLLSQFKSARENAMRSAADKQGKALKSVSALVKFSQGAKNQKSPPKPKASAADRNAAILEEMHIEVKPKTKEDDHRHHRDDAKRNSTRSTSTVKADKYDGDDDATNGSRRSHNDRDKRGRGRERGHDDGRGKSRGRSRSRERDLSPEDRGRSRSRERALSPEHRGKSRTRDHNERRGDDRRHYDDEPPYYRRSHSPERRRYPPEDRYSRSPQHYRNPHGSKEPDWVEQFRRGRERSSQPVRRAWVNDPRRVEVVPGGSRRRPMRELDMDAFERDVRNATAYNSDFEQPPEPRRQMLPTKFMAGPPRQRRGPPPGDWMSALRDKNRSAARARHIPARPPPIRGSLKYYYVQMK